jgi:hypothetical protein
MRLNKVRQQKRGLLGGDRSQTLANSKHVIGVACRGRVATQIEPRRKGDAHWMPRENFVVQISVIKTSMLGQQHSNTHSVTLRPGPLTLPDPRQCPPIRPPESGGFGPPHPHAEFLPILPYPGTVMAKTLGQGRLRLVRRLLTRPVSQNLRTQHESCTRPVAGSTVSSPQADATQLPPRKTRFTRIWFFRFSSWPACFRCQQTHQSGPGR